ncbi:MAG: MFS transporter [Planctomycetota bacterium]
MKQVNGITSLMKSFSTTYWSVIVMEFFERSAFYGMMAILADYFVENIGNTEQWGLLRSVLNTLLYIIPIFSGALAEKWGYKKVLTLAFVLMTLAYIGAGSYEIYPVFFGFMILLGLGGGLFKPVISSSIARSTDASNSTLGFGIYYWTINVGSFIASLVAAHYATAKDYQPLFMFSAAYVCLMLFNNFFFYKEPRKPNKIKTFGDTVAGIALVFSNWRFILLLLIFSGFWGMYNRSTDSALWLLRENYIDLTPVNDVLTRIGTWFGSKEPITFTVANIMTINAGVIILGQLPVSYLVRNTKPLPTMIVGVALASLFPLLVALSNNPWVFILGLVVFSIGEITAYPKLISYVGLISPRDKVAIYMGFVFLPVCFASLIFDYPNGVLWDRLVIRGDGITTYWFIVAGLGGVTVLSLILYHLFVGKKLALSEGTGGDDTQV